MKHNYVKINHINLHYVSVGSGPLLIFLHGFPEFWYQWKEYFGEFGKDYFVVAPDMRGFNLSDKPEKTADYEIHHLTKDLYELINHLGYKKCILVGNDWGGFIAWSFAMIYPQYCEKLVVISAPHPAVLQKLLRSNAAQQKAGQYTVLLRSSQAEKSLSENQYNLMFNWILLPLTEKNLLTKEDKVAYIQAWAQPNALRSALNYYHVQHEWPADKIDVPTLILVGEKDNLIIDENWQNLEDYLSHYVLQKIPDGTHWMTHEKPALIMQYIRDFIS